MRGIILAGLLHICTISFACDICGGVSSNASIGLFASTQFHTIGIRSSYRGFSTYMNGIRHSQEFLFGQEAQFRTQLNKRFQLMGTIPFQNAIQIRDFGKDFVSGIGDPTIIGNFILYQKRDSTGFSKNFLSMGLGVKAPLGQTVSNANVLKNLYPGTGSWDFLVLTNYTKQFSKLWGWQTEISFAHKGKDKFGFQYGNSIQVSSQVFVNQKIGSYRLIVSTGINYEQYAASRLNGDPIVGATNQGMLLSARASANILTYRWLWSFSVQQPFMQNINEGSIRQNTGATISLNYLLKK